MDDIKKMPSKEKPHRTVGRLIVPCRKILDIILCVQRTAVCQRKMLPKRCGWGSSCRHRLQEWNRLDVFKRIWSMLLKIYDKEVGINWARKPVY